MNTVNPDQVSGSSSKTVTKNKLILGPAITPRLVITLYNLK